MLRFGKVAAGFAASCCLVGLAADLAGGAGPRWDAVPLTKAEMSRVRGGAGSCFVENNSPCNFGGVIGECRGPVAAGNNPCDPAVGWYQAVNTLFRVVTAPAGKAEVLSGETVWCYNKYQCVPTTKDGQTVCGKGSYVGHTPEHVEEFPTGADCIDE